MESILNARIEELEKQVHELQTSQTSRTRPAESKGLAESSAAGPMVQTTHTSLELVIPNVAVTQRAVEGFFSCSGKLFHVEVGSETEGRKADLGSLMAVAAVGSQYANVVIEDRVRETFYNVAKLRLEDVITQRPLESIKVCTLLCMYNVFGKATVSLAYSDAGLGICDRYGLHCQRRQLDGITDSMWLDYRKAWRTLIFLSTWLSATLGYRTSNYQVLQRAISSSQLQIDDQPSISEVVQTEMTKIAVLKAKILHMHLAFKYLAIEPLNSMIQDLQDWYKQLPPANMLLFRRIVAENIRVHQRDTSLSLLWHSSNNLLSKQNPDALVAANTSARILKLLLDENGIFQRCWLVIFQTYTSCIIIMHAILKNLVLSLMPSPQDETTNARLCLEVLAYCGSADPMAGRFHEKAQAIFNSLLEHIENHPEALNNPRQKTSAEQDPLSSKITANSPSKKHPQNIGMHDENDDPSVLPVPYHRSVRDLSFKDHSYHEGIKESLAATNASNPTRYEHSILIKKLDWDYENSVPFQWDSKMLGLGSVEAGMLGEASSPNTQGGNRFLDSMHPSGWT
ncbi:hypothetical protein F5Y09DRAFT_334682 [Xylaria sp. FL1042]|nr:hypothetical protein F5Y09DRAFT_334682 [Xylaria sp. FL1042]